jgi:site-specific DNA-methyltransferase (adenine-specific)
MIRLLQGDCREQLRDLSDASVDSIVTDPPYELGFMGRKWDASGIAYDGQVWAECLRVLKPGGHLLAFGGTRTYHRMTCAIEDAGFEVRDCIMWVYGSGFPKSHNLEGQWQGWGSALKPAVEPIVCARKPLIGTIAENVLAHGTGAINVDGCRIGHDVPEKRYNRQSDECDHVNPSGWKETKRTAYRLSTPAPSGRWPANLIHDGSPEVVELFPQTTSGAKKPNHKRIGGYGGDRPKQVYGTYKQIPCDYLSDSGSAARFFYCAKTSPSERGDNRHPTVKPISLMRYLCRLVTPPKGVVLDPFAGSGTTLVAARAEGFSAIGCELMPEHIEIIKRRLDMPIDPVTIEDKVETEQPTKTTKDKPVQLKLLL